MFEFLTALAVLGGWLTFVRPRRKRERETYDNRWAALNVRVYELEAALTELRNESASNRQTATAQRLHPEPEVVAPPAPVQQVREEPRPETVVQRVERTFEPDAPSFALHTPPSVLKKLTAGLDLEEALSANWLNKIGIVILVIGVALFLAYQLQHVGLWGKVSVGVLVSAALLAGGVFLERKPGYRILGHAGIGGGWALAFFTAYAMYHVPPARVFPSQLPDLLLMLAVGAAMVTHTLRYRSQVVTGLAFLLAFATLPISQVTAYSLSGEAILASALVIIIWRMRWFELELFGIAAVYGVHWWWLRGIVEPMGAHKHPFPEFFPSAALLVFYWAIFRASYILRRCDEREEKVSTAAVLLSSAGLLALLRYQSVYPEWAFSALTVLGTVELALAYLPRTLRRVAFLMLATIGTSLIIAALPFRFSGSRLDVSWLLEAETLLLAGIFAREILFRRLGMIASVLPPLYLLPAGAEALMDRRAGGSATARDFTLALLCLVASLISFANSHVVRRRWPELFEHRFDRVVMDCFSYLGGFLLFVGAWAAFPDVLMPLAWAVLGSILMAIGSRFAVRQLSFQAHFYFLCAFIVALTTNLTNGGAWGFASKRLVTVGIVAATFYTASRWSRAAAGEWPRVWRALPIVYRCSASLLLVLLACYALHGISVAPALLLLALTLVETGRRLDMSDVRAQGYVTLAIAFIATLTVNLNAEYPAGGEGLRLWTVFPVVLGMYWVYASLARMSTLPALESRFPVAANAAWCGAIGLAALLRFEVSLDWVAAAWAGCALALLSIAWKTGLSLLLQQAIFFALAAAFRGSLHNLYERSYLPGPFWYSTAVCTTIAAALLFAGLPFAFRLRLPDRGKASARSGREWLLAITERPEQIFFFLPLSLLVALLAVEMRSGLITLSWSVLGVAVFLFALIVSERSFRLAGLALLLLGVARIVCIDVWLLNAQDRYLTFIAMGSALLLVSFLYSRHRNTIRRYL